MRGSGAGRQQAPRLVGRDAERAALAGALAGLATGEGGAVVVHGDAGLGKTRLVRDALDEAGRDIAVLRGNAYLLDRDLAYAPVVEALTRHLDGLGDADRFELLDGLGVLGTLLDGYGLVTPEPLEPAVDRLRRAEAVRRLLMRMASRRPVVVAIDDVHWADDQTLEVLQRLVRDVAEHPLLLLLSYRTGEMRPGLQQLVSGLRRAGALHEIQLAPLDEADARELAEAWLDDAPAFVVDAVTRRAAGNPLFVAALARNAVARDDPDSPPPDVAADLLLSRTRDLDGGTRDVLDLLAVAGIPVTAGTIAAVAGGPAEDIEAALAILMDAGLVGPPDDRARVTVAHPLILEAAYQAVAPLRRTRLHAAYVGHLEAQPASDLGHLARHVRGARGEVEPARALEILTEAGERALGRGSSREAVQHLTAALDVARAAALGGLARLLELLAAAWINEHEPLAGESVLNEAIEAYSRSGDAAGEARCRVMAAAVAWYAGEAGSARSELDTALELASRTDDVVTHAALITRQAHLAHSMGELAPAEAAATAMHALVATTDHPAILAAGDIVDAWRAQLAGDLEATVAAATRALGRPATTYTIDPSLWALHHRAQTMRAHANAALGRIREAVTDTEASLAVAEGLAAPIVAWRSQVAGLAVAVSCRPPDGIASALEGVRWSFGDGDPSNAKVIALAEAWAAVACEDPATAAPLLAFAAEPPAPRHGGQWVMVLSDAANGLRAAGGPDVGIDLTLPAAPLTLLPPWGHDARITNAAGDPAALLAIAEEVGRFGPPGTWPALMADRARALASGGAAAAEGVATAAAAVEQLGLTRIAAWWWVEAAEVAAAAGSAAVAVDAARQALLLAGDLTLPRTADRARKVLRGLGVRTSAPQTRSGELTSRQMEIARLVAEGLTSAEVAERLFISVRTVTTHLDNVYTALGIGSRAQLATWLARQTTDT